MDTIPASLRGLVDLLNNDGARVTTGTPDSFRTFLAANATEYPKYVTTEAAGHLVELETGEIYLLCIRQGYWTTIAVM